MAVTSIATIEDGASGLTGSTAKGDTKDEGKKEETGKKEDGKKEDTAKKEEEPKKKGFGLGALKQTVAPERQSAQVSASGGARGVGPDRLAKGGDNPNTVKVTVSAAELDAFKKGIA